MWPMTPVVHMTYRLWQLGRGSLLVSVLEGPVWLIYLQVSCQCRGWPGAVRLLLCSSSSRGGQMGFANTFAV